MSVHVLYVCMYVCMYGGSSMSVHVLLNPLNKLVKVIKC